MLHLPAQIFTFLANTCEPSHPISQMNRLRIRGVARLSQSQEGRALRQPVIWGFPSVKQGNDGPRFQAAAINLVQSEDESVSGCTRFFLNHRDSKGDSSTKWLFEQLSDVSDTEASDTR